MNIVQSRTGSLRGVYQTLLCMLVMRNIHPVLQDGSGSETRGHWLADENVSTCNCCCCVMLLLLLCCCCVVVVLLCCCCVVVVLLCCCVVVVLLFAERLDYLDQCCNPLLQRLKIRVMGYNFTPSGLTLLQMLCRDTLSRILYPWIYTLSVTLVMSQS